MSVFDRWFGTATPDPTVAARQRSAAWGAYLAQQRAALPPRPMESTAPMAVEPLAPMQSPIVAAPAPAPSHRTTTATTTVLVIEDGEEAAI